MICLPVNLNPFLVISFVEDTAIQFQMWMFPLSHPDQACQIFMFSFDDPYNDCYPEVSSILASVHATIEDWVFVPTIFNRMQGQSVLKSR